MEEDSIDKRYRELIEEHRRAQQSLEKIFSGPAGKQLTKSHKEHAIKFSEDGIKSLGFRLGAIRGKKENQDELAKYRPLYEQLLALYKHAEVKEPVLFRDASLEFRDKFGIEPSRFFKLEGGDTPVMFSDQEKRTLQILCIDVIWHGLGVESNDQ